MHCYIQNIEGGSCGLKENDFSVHPIISLWKPMTMEWSQFGFQGHDWQTLFREQLDIVIYTLHISCELHGFRQENVSKVFPIISLLRLLLSRAWAV